MVLEMPIEVYFWNAACILTCHSLVISCEVTHTLRTSSGTSSTSRTEPCWAIFFISSSE
jgi:hypothetical protein